MPSPARALLLYASGSKVLKPDTGMADQLAESRARKAGQSDVTASKCLIGN